MNTILKNRCTKNAQIAVIVGLAAFMIGCAVHFADAQEVEEQTYNGTFISEMMEANNGTMWDGMILDEYTGNLYVGNSSTNRVYIIPGSGPVLTGEEQKEPVRPAENQTYLGKLSKYDQMVFALEIEEDIKDWLMFTRCDNAVNIIEAISQYEVTEDLEGPKKLLYENTLTEFIKKFVEVCPELAEEKNITPLSIEH